MSNKRDYPIATIVLIVINAIVFIAMYYGPVGISNAIASQALTASAIEHGRWWTLITSMFMHGGFAHILANMISLYFLGELCEKVFGVGKFLILYFVSGIVGGLFFVAVYNMLGLAGSVVGASGAIFGLFGAYGVLIIGERKNPVVFAHPVSSSTLVYYFVLLVANVMVGFTPGIAIEAHAGGFVSGIIVGWIMYEQIKRQRMARYRQV